MRARPLTADDRRAEDGPPGSAWFPTFEDFFRARATTLVRFARVQLADHHAAEDVVAEVLAKTSVRWRRIRTMDSPEAYVRRMLVNECLSLQRRAAYRREQNTDPDRLREVAVGDRTDEVSDRDAIWRYVQSLPPKQRAVLVLRHLDGVSDDEIADILGIGVGTVRSHASLALRTLRTMLGPEDRP